MKRHTPLSHLALLLSALMPVTLAAQPASQMAEKFLTISRGDEYAPAISADGCWLVYVGERDAAPALELIDLASRLDPATKSTRIRPPQPLFPHPAQSTSPVFSPSGKTPALAFVSRREDALGDIYLIPDVTNPKLVRLSDRMTRDSAPRFVEGPNGLAVVYTAQPHGSAPEERAYDLKTRRAIAVPAPDVARAYPAPPGPVVGGSLASGVILLATEDTNRDSVFDEGDAPTVWVMRGEQGSFVPHDKSAPTELMGTFWRQISAPIPDAGGVAIRPSEKGEVLVSGRFRESIDIVVLDRTLFDTERTTAEWFEEARKLQRRWGSESELALVCLRRAAAVAVTQEEKGVATVEIGRALNRAGRAWQSAQFLEQARGAFEEGSTMRLRIESQFLSARATLTREQELRNPFALKLNENIEGQFLDLIKRFDEGNLPEDAADARIALAELYLTQEKPLDAARLTEQVTANTSASIDARVRASILRSDLFRSLGLGSETSKSLVDALALNPPNESLRASITDRLINETVTEANLRGESPILALRALLANARGISYLATAIKVREGRLLITIPNRPDALAAWSEAMAAPPEAAQQSLAAGKAALEAFADSEEIELLAPRLEALAKALQENFPGSLEAEEGAHLHEQAMLASGRRALVLGDAMLALSVMDRLLATNPLSHDGFRIRMEAISTNPALMDEELLRTAAAVKSTPRSAAAWYARGLALSYPQPIAKETLRAVDRAIDLDGTVPQFHLLRGFLFEQQFDESRRKGRTLLPLLEQASQAYEQGVSLVASGENPRLRADFLLNEANVALGLGQNYKANDLYRRRAETGIPLQPIERNLIFHMNSGIAAFQAADPARAERQFSRAIELMDSKASLATRRSLRYELLGRQALAMLDMRRYAEAAARFTDALELAPERSLARVRIKRNIAFMLERQSSSLPPIDQAPLLHRARQVATECLAELKDPELKPDPDYTRSGGLIDMSILITSDVAGGGAKLKLDVSDEERLLHALVGRIAQRIGDSDAAVANWRAQVEREPAIDDTNRAYFLSLRAVALNRIAAEEARSGRRFEAMYTVSDALDATRFDVVDQKIMNGGGATMLLLQMLELKLANFTVLPGSPNTLALVEPGAFSKLPRQPDAWWMVDAALLTSGSDWELLSQAASSLLQLEDPVLLDGTPLITSGLDQCRLRLIQAIAAEAESMRLRTSTAVIEQAKGILLLRSADQQAERVITGAELSESLQDGRRLALAAWAVRVRLAQLAGEPLATERITEARTWLRNMGHGEKNWWLTAVLASNTNNEEARQALVEQSLRELETARVLRFEPSDAIPTALLERLEQIQLAAAEDLGDVPAALTAADRWQAVRLRWMVEHSAPKAFDEQQQEWLTTWRTRRATLQKATQALRALPRDAEGVREVRLEVLDRAGRELDDHLQLARTRGWSIAEALAPTGLGFEAYDALAAQGVGTWLLRSAAGRTVQAVYTAEGARFLTGDEAFGATGPMVVLGRAPEQELEISAHVLTSTVLLRNAEYLVLRNAQAPTPYPSEKGTPIAGAPAIEVTVPVQAGDLPAASWLVGETAQPLQAVLDMAGTPERFIVTLQLPISRAHEVVDARLRLASWLQSRGVREAIIDGEQWLSVPLDEEGYRARAQEEFALSRARLSEAFRMESNEAALRALRRIIAIREALNQTVIETEEGTPDLLSVDHANLAQVALRSGRPAEAYTAALRALALEMERGADADAMTTALLLAGDSATRSGKHAEAVGHFDRAALLLEEHGRAEELPALQFRIADAHEADGNYQAALAVTDAAIERLAGGDTVTSQRAVLRAARVLQRRLSRYAEAEKRLEAIRDEVAPEVRRDWLVMLAGVYQSVARFEDATKLLDEAETLSETPLQQAEITLDRGNNAWLRSDYFNAFRMVQDGRAMLEATDPDDLSPDDRNHWRTLRIVALNLSGLTAWAVNDTDRAHRDFQAARDLAKEYAIESEYASSCNNSGLVYRSEDKLADASRWFEQALLSDRERGDVWGEAYSLRNLGITLMKAGRPADSLPPLNRAVELTTGIGDNVNLVKALVARGDSHEMLGDCAAASADFASALELARAIPIPEMQWRCLYGLGRCRLAAGSQPDALALYNEAAEVVDALRASIRVEEFQNGFLLDKQTLYQDLVRLQLDMGNTAGALESSERSRGRNFIDLLGNTPLNLANVKDAGLLVREGELRRGIEQLERALSVATPKERGALNQQLTDRLREYQDFLIVLRSEDPELASFRRVEPVTVASLQAMLEPETRLLIYHVLENEVAIWLLGPATLTVHRTQVDEKELNERMSAARIRIQTFEPMQGELEPLSSWLIRPILPELEGVVRIGVVPHRELHVLPFGALPTTGDRALIDEAALFFAPSASVLKYTFARRETANRSNKVLGIGNPDRGAASNLPFAQKEAERLQFSFADVNVRTGAGATESWLVDNLKDFGIIHIASHGEYDPNLPLFSSLLLGADQENDGRLSAQEIFGLQTRADLIALSACQTGLGRVTSGDDIIGLNRAFVYAGTRQLVTTLWRVDDISTSILFKYFYREIDKTDRAEALRRAQLQLKRRPEFEHPARWGAVVLSGDWK